uniref:Secreted protein n=1 Tax=Plectus sambesii TaxID=2011161 RepID=A0A914W2S8_9BILA
MNKRAGAPTAAAASIRPEAGAGPTQKKFERFRMVLAATLRRPTSATLVVVATTAAAAAAPNTNGTGDHAGGNGRRHQADDRLAPALGHSVTINMQIGRRAHLTAA